MPRPRLTLDVTDPGAERSVVDIPLYAQARSRLRTGVIAYGVAGGLFAHYLMYLHTNSFTFIKSFEIILGPIIGGLGTLFGPILGAAVLTVLADGITELMALAGLEIPGVKQVFYGVCLLLVVMFLPNGVWPPLARKLKLDA